MTATTIKGLNKSTEEIGTLLHAAAGLILRHEEPAPFLEWAGRYAPELAPSLFAMARDTPARSALARIGRKPFRAFKDALLGYPQERENGFRFKDAADRQHAEARLEDNGIEARLISVPPVAGPRDGKSTP